MERTVCLKALEPFCFFTRERLRKGSSMERVAVAIVVVVCRSRFLNSRICLNQFGAKTKTVVRCLTLNRGSLEEAESNRAVSSQYLKGFKVKRDCPCS